MKSSRFLKLNLLFYSFCIFIDSSKIGLTGLDHFSFLDQIDQWTIESKLDSTTGQVSCRASIKGSGIWFSDRTRLDKNDKLIIRSEIKNPNLINKHLIAEVKIALSRCRKDLLYLEE
tara:strand:- start:148 stop:498 length:351 start_codon:yes stop_codon:yes gene_type:complete